MQVIYAKQVFKPAVWQSDLKVTIGRNCRILHLGPVSSEATHRTELLLPATLNLHSHAF